MSWTRWWAVMCVATLGALLLSIGAGDFDREKRAARRQAEIEQVRATSGVQGAAATAMPE